MSRETLSQDDVGREVFTEIDRNLAKIAFTLEWRLTHSSRHWTMVEDHI
jgi:hypothetical protein